MHIRSLLIGLAVVFCAAAVQAGNDTERRLAAELVVMSGDVRILIAGKSGPQERKGLILRLQGGLSSLPLLLRRAGSSPELVAAMRTDLARENWRTLAASLESLMRRHRFNATRLLSQRPTPKALALGAAIHRDTCATCHDVDWGDTLLPAKILSAQLAIMPREEFAARIWLGVRGTRETAYANPFSDDELAALIAYYSTTTTTPSGQHRESDRN